MKKKNKGSKRKDKEPYKNYQINLPVALVKQLDHIAVDREISRQALIRDMITFYISHELVE